MGVESKHAEVSSTVVIRRHKMYLDSKVWVCDESPTGAHHWIGDARVMVCKYCGKVSTPRYATIYREDKHKC